MIGARLRRALDAVLLRDEVDCDCPGCSFNREVEALTPAHVAAAILLDAESLADVEARVAMIGAAVAHAVDVANHEWLDPAALAEVEALDALYDAPSFGEDRW